jgi:hypothetical protein
MRGRAGLLYMLAIVGCVVCVATGPSMSNLSSSSHPNQETYGAVLNAGDRKMMFAEGNTADATNSENADKLEQESTLVKQSYASKLEAYE